jgi:hypothetical protein
MSWILFGVLAESTKLNCMPYLTSQTCVLNKECRMKLRNFVKYVKRDQFPNMFLMCIFSKYVR